MSKENVELVQRAWELFLTTGDIPRELIHEDVEFHWNPDFPDAQIYYGPDELLRALREWQEMWEGTEYEFFEFRDAGDHLLIGFRETGRGRSGIETNRVWFQVYTFRDGKLAMLREFSDRAEALEAAELTTPWRRLRARVRDRARERSAQPA